LIEDGSQFIGIRRWKAGRTPHKLVADDLPVHDDMAPCTVKRRFVAAIGEWLAKVRTPNVSGLKALQDFRANAVTLSIQLRFANKRVLFEKLEVAANKSRNGSDLTQQGDGDKRLSDSEHPKRILAPRRAELTHQEKQIADQQDRLLNLVIDGKIDSEALDRKQTKFRDRLASIMLQPEVLNRTRDEKPELAVKVFELSQTFRRQWLTADCAARRRILELVWLNYSLIGASLCPSIRKPFDVLAEGLFISSSRSDKI
jgi:hypothetical protein